MNDHLQSAKSLIHKVNNDSYLTDFTLNHFTHLAIAEALIAIAELMQEKHEQDSIEQEREYMTNLYNIKD